MSENMDCEANGNQDLLEVIVSGTAKQVRAVLAKLDPLSCKDRCGNSFLHTAVLHRARPSNIKAIIDLMGEIDIANDDGETPLAMAAANGNSKITQMLLDAGADPNAEDDQGRTALMNASDSGHEAIVAMLMKHGADVNAVDRHQETALMIAASWGYHKVVQALVRGGAACDLPNKDGWTALTFAQDFGHAEVVKILQKYSNGKERRAA